MNLSGRPIEIRYAAALRDTAGNPAHAATYIRKRVIILDQALRRDPLEHGRILVHELFHFVWVRLSNGERHNWEKLLRLQWDARARGEAGWSAEWRKRLLTSADADRRTRKWREYCCEAFCDTAAYLCSGSRSEVTLASRHLVRRRDWFAKQFQNSFPI